MAARDVLDTIVAIATPMASGAIGVVRLSGSSALTIAHQLFLNPHFSKELQSHRVYYGTVYDPHEKCPLDKALCIYMQGPRSFTGEDVVEFQCHGGLFLLKTILKLCIQAGARLAQPGEFSQRAFINGKLDLTQIEAIADLVNGQSKKALHQATYQLEGRLSQRVVAMRKQLLDLLVKIEAHVDFPDEVDAPDMELFQQTLQLVWEDSQKLLASAQAGRMLREGVRVAIVGQPNVGKSTLLNALLRSDRAIVSDIPGTTRDTIEEYCMVRGILLHLVDTAGFRTTRDTIESIGIQRSLAAIAQSQLVLLVADATLGFGNYEQTLLEHAQGKEIIVVWNKIDCLPTATVSSVFPPLEQYHAVAISALSEAGIQPLEAHIYQLLQQNHSLDYELTINERHQACIEKACEAIQQLQQHLQEGHWPIDCLSIDLYDAIGAFGEVIGEGIQEEVIGHIFSQFCVGK